MKCMFWSKFEMTNDTEFQKLMLNHSMSFVDCIVDCSSSKAIT